jgi:hypothetical protein
MRGFGFLSRCAGAVPVENIAECLVEKPTNCFRTARDVRLVATKTLDGRPQVFLQPHLNLARINIFLHGCLPVMNG